jgi:radical SAM superfamily enzyme YgiQ (UPF0313 family)
MKKVLLVQPKDLQGVDWAFYPPSGLLSLATVLMEKGFEVKLVDTLAENLSNLDLEIVIQSFAPDVIGLSINTMLLDHAVELGTMFRKIAPEALLVAGGPHVTCVRENIFNDIPQLDVVFVGEAEETLPEFLLSEKRKNIPGVIRKGERFEGIIPFVDDLEGLPFPDFSLVIMEKYYGFQRNAEQPTAFVNCSRGCRYNCFFCSNPVRKRPVRFRSVSSVMEELHALKEKHNVKEVFFMDDMFNSDIRWSESIFSEIIKHWLDRCMRFVVQFRVNEIITPPSLFRLAAEAGVYCIIFGVESGSQKILDTCNKKIKVAEIERAFDLAHQYGLMNVASFILGLPGEDEATVSDTMKLFNRIRPTLSGVGYATPLPGTRLRKYYEDNDFLYQKDFRGYSFCRCIIRTENFSREQLENQYQRLFQAFSIEHIV